MTQSSRLFAAIVVGSLILGLGAAGVAHATSSSQAEQGSLAQDIDADSVVLTADIDSGGDADWAIEYRLDLDDETDEAAFDELVDEIEENSSAYLDPFEQRMRTTAETAESATGRTMSVDTFDISTTRRDQPQGSLGVVTFSFEWRGFAASEDNRIEAGDALDRLILADNERLQFSWPESYSLQSSSPEPSTVESQRVVWRGQIDFDAGQPRIELAADEESSTPFVWLLGPLVVLVLVAAGAYWWLQRTDSDDESVPDAGSSAGTTGEGSATPPSELLSNEERALQLLQDNGGRMKQKALAEELDWSAAKTSQVVADLREDDRVESFRLGRENVLTLPEVDIDGSPANEETDPSG